MTRSVPRSATFEERSSTLSWIATLLWGRDAVVHAGLDRVFDPARSFFVLPDLDHPRFLVPVGSRRAGAAALRQFNDSMSQAARIRKAAASRLFELGLGSRLVRDRISIVTPQSARDDGSIGALLAEIFDRSDLQISVALGSTLRPNIKPIVQVTTDTGDVLGYVKVGWNDLTRRLVENEASVVSEWQERPPTSFHVPRVVYRGTWNDLAVTVLSPIAHHVVRRARRNVLPPLEVIREIAKQIEVAPLGGDYLVDLSARVKASSLGDPDRGRVARVLDGIEERGSDAAVPFGAWHGDFGPWNMSRAASGLSIWDWERSAVAVPVGFDVLHFGFQVAYAVRGSSVATAARETAARGRAPLDALGVPQPMHRDILAAYLIERILRVDEGRANGVRVRSELTGQILDHLEGEGTR